MHIIFVIIAVVVVVVVVVVADTSVFQTIYFGVALISVVL